MSPVDSADEVQCFEILLVLKYLIQILKARGNLSIQPPDGFPNSEYQNISTSLHAHTHVV